MKRVITLLSLAKTSKPDKSKMNTTKAPLPKYRIEKYDKDDATYANVVKASFQYHTVSTQEIFNTFTENLMEDTHISRFQLLDAIDDYTKSQYSRNYPLRDLFTNNAFNFRPYQ